MNIKYILLMMTNDLFMFIFIKNLNLNFKNFKKIIK